MTNRERNLHRRIAELDALVLELRQDADEARRERDEAYTAMEREYAELVALRKMVAGLGRGEN